MTLEISLTNPTLLCSADQALTCEDDTSGVCNLLLDLITMQVEDVNGVVCDLPVGVQRWIPADKDGGGAYVGIGHILNRARH